MLTELRIRNFAIIESLSVTLAPGLNVLTGETGAGKSIVVGALGVLLGERASGDLVRPGADRALVEGTFECGGREELLALLDDLGVYPEDDRLVLRREITSAGRTRAWINDASTTAGSIARVGQYLVDIHGQHEARSLLLPDVQRAILDDFAGTAEIAGQVLDAWERRASALRDIAALERSRTEAAQRADYLRHVVQEISGAALEPGEEALLEREAARLENADELRALAGGAAGLLEGDEDAALTRLAAVQRTLASARRLDPTLARHDEALETAFYALQELARDLDAYAEAVELDPERLAQVRQRRELLHRLTRKYGGRLEDVIALGERSRAELDLLDTAGLDLRLLEQRRDEAARELQEACGRLSMRRKEAARRLTDAVQPLLGQLGMPDGRFSVVLGPLPEPAAHGAESVEFRASLNVGHDPRPLSRIASGGELSRVMLALETVLARVDRVPTLIFDEVDAGIGGRVGLHVGDTMRRVAEHHQVLAITHLAQIASRAHHHLVVSKGAKEGVTAADVVEVAGEQRVAEIARMLGGDAESELSREHARELLASVEQRDRRPEGAGKRRGRRVS